MSNSLGNPYSGGGTVCPNVSNVSSQPSNPVPNVCSPNNPDLQSVTVSNHSETLPVSTPPLDKIENVSGYEGITFATTTLPPPISPDLPTVPPERPEINRGAGITEEEVREAAINYVSEKCCYGKDPVQNMVITDITLSSAFHYTLETFGEKRETNWACDPYNGEILDTPMMGVAPPPWKIHLTPIREFNDSVQTMEVPHTASAISCHVCMGTGCERCPNCQGCCMELCSWCRGSGKSFDKICNYCNGIGRIRCSKCHGSGLMKCHTCDGKRSLKYYVKLIATWKNHKEDFIVENRNLPDELIRGVTGEIAFEEQDLRVWPINHFQTNINKASSRLVQKHSQEFEKERILQQRQRVRIIPVAQVNYNWKDRSGEFFVYGFENKVYFPNYPQSCCCGCNIL